jgi:hypothetical protein
MFSKSGERHSLNSFTAVDATARFPVAGLRRKSPFNLTSLYGSLAMSMHVPRGAA